MQPLHRRQPRILSASYKTLERGLDRPLPAPRRKEFCYFEPAGIRPSSAANIPLYHLRRHPPDPEVKLDIEQIQKITTTFLQQIIRCRRRAARSISAGNAARPEDLFAELERRKEFYSTSCPALISEKEKRVLWPEYWGYDAPRELPGHDGRESIQQRVYVPADPERGRLLFDPGTGHDHQTPAQELRPLPDRKPKFKTEWTYGGMDLGKKRILAPRDLRGPRDSSLSGPQQIHDGWNHIDQLEYVRECIKFFKVARPDFDNTRAEFEGFYEAGELGGNAGRVSFNSKNNLRWQPSFDKLVTKEFFF